MDKRAIVFVITLTVALFFINQWFGSKSKDQKLQTIQTEQIQTIQGQTVSEVEIKSRTAPLSSLPIVKLYKDAEGKEIASEAVKIEDNYITLAWMSPLPDQLYILAHKGWQYEKITRRTDSKEKKFPVLYSVDPKPVLPVASLPEIGASDLQVIYFSDDNLNVDVALATYENGAVYFPMGKINSNGIALYKTKNGFLPFGVYEANRSNLRPIKDYPYFGEIAVPQFFGVKTAAKAGEQEFFVLENSFQQLVFSNIGGALCEINLPFRTKDNKQSVVREIEFDRTLQKDYPYADYFPASSYHIAKDGSSVLMNKGKLGGYYPLLRRSQIGPLGRTAYSLPFHYYAFNLVSEDFDLASTVFKVTRFEKNLIQFEGVQGQRKIIKTYSFPQNAENSPYCFDLSIKVEGDARGLFLTSGVPEVELISGTFSPALKYRVTRSGKSVVEKVDLPKKNSVSFTSIQPDWICNSNGFLGLIVDPLTEAGSGFSAYKIDGQLNPTRISLIDAQHNLYPADKYPGYEMHLPLPSSSQTTKFRIFAGPFDTAVLQKVDASYSNSSTGYNPDYVSCQSFHGWFSFISEPFAQFLFMLLKFFHRITFSWGISIILLTVVLRIMLYPLNAWSIKSTTKMQQAAPQVTAIQEKYKKDPKRAQMEVMSLYREKGINPLTGCLPLIIQMPFLIGMFDLLKSSFELRGVSFIPGWIDNLTAPDVVFSWSYPIVFFGTQFHLLPILLGIVMYIQQKFSSSASKNQKVLTDQQRQQKFMGNIMVIVFTVMFYHFPSGLNIYWLSSMLLGIVQQWYMTKKMSKTPILTVVEKHKN